MDAARALDQIPYIRIMPRDERDALARVCEVRQVPRGRSLFSEGDPPEGVFLILSGRVRVVRSSEDGREQVLHEEGTGSTLAEVPLFDGDGYVGSALAVEDALVCCVPRAALLAALHRSPASCLEVIRILAARVRALAVMVEDLSLKAVSERLAAYLLRRTNEARSGSFQLPQTRDELAAHVGTVREQVSRALSDLRAADIIDLRGRMVSIKDPDRLRVVANPSSRPSSTPLKKM